MCMIKVLLYLFVFVSSQNTYAQITEAYWERNGSGFKDAHGNFVGANNYYSTYWNSDAQHGIVKNANGLEGVVDKWGKIVIPIIYSNIIVVKDFALTTNKDGQKGYYNLNGYKKIYEGAYDKIEGSIAQHDVILKKDHKYGVGDDDTGNIYIPLEYDYIEESISGVHHKILVSKGGQYDEFGHYHNGKWGLYVDRTLAVPCEYDTINTTIVGEEDMYAINKNGKWGFCSNGKEIIAPQYDAVTNFVNGVATVRKDREVKLIKNPLKDGSHIMIAEGGSGVNNKKKVGGPAVSRYPAPDSDVDKGIPVAKGKAENTFAFIIANENYPDAPVPYSLNDGRMFKEYCQKTLGLPEKNVNLYEDATFGNIITAVEKMKQVADAYDGDASVILYYAGHGFPDDKQQTAYLLPIDGDASSITTTGYSLAKLYKEIAGLKLKSAVVFLDACFSGAKREDQMLASSRGVAIKVKEEAPQGNMLVFSAAQGDETAHQLEDKHHGLFTYYLLKQLQATGGNVDMGTLTEYVTKQVKRQSVVINNKKQTPTVIPSQALMNSWQTMKLR